MNAKFFISFSVFSIVGAFARYLIDQWSNRLEIGLFPWHTFAINCLGSFLLGALSIWSMDRWGMSSEWRFILGTGLLGSFTTFSAFSLQNILLIQQGHWALSASYSIASVVGGISASFLGILCMRGLG